MSSDQFNSTYFRRKDPVLRFSNLSEIKSIINRYENNDRVVTATRISPPRPASYCGDVNVIYGDRVFPMEEIVPYSDTTDRAFQNVYYDDDMSKLKSRYWPLNALMQFVLCFMKCWLGIGTTSFALMCVIVITFAPKILTEIFIYPCCRLLFGTLYPAYASYKAIRTKNVKEYVKWMMYWIVFALFTCAETFTDVFFSWLPFYYEIKVILVFWLLSPAFKGSSILYRKFVHPALCSREQEIDECISKAKEQGYHTVLNLGSRGVNYATNVIMQTALKSGGGLVQQLRKSYSLSDLTASEDHSDGRSQQEIDEANNAVASDPRLVRRTVSVRGRSPRTYSAPKVDMDFPEMDVLVGHNARNIGRDMVKLSQIRSSEDISSVPENATDQDLLMRTSSVGGSTRMRSKVTRSTFTSIKRPGAAEDGEVIIEEVDDRQIPLDYPADDNSTDYSFPGFANYVSPFKNLTEINQFMDFVKTGCLPENGIGNNLEVTHQRYLELKKIFESHEPKNRTIDNNIESTNIPETIISENNSKNEKNEVEICQISKENIENTNMNVESNKTEEIGKIEEISKTKDIDKAEKISETEEITKNEEISKTVEISKTKEIGKTEEISKTDNNFKVSLDTTAKEDVSVSSPEKDKKEIETSFNIGGSLLSLNSLNESDSSAKQKKRRAPLPPVDQSKLVEGLDNKFSNKKTEIVKEENANINNQDLQQTDKSKDIKSKKNKQDSSISKLLHLPSKLAFWNKADEEANKSSAEISKESPNLSIENINDSNISDLQMNSVIDVNNILSLQKLSTSLDSINDAFEDACDIPVNEGSESSSDLLKDVEKTKPNTRHEIANSGNRNEDIQHIPLKLETLVLHTESKSTDV